MGLLFFLVARQWRLNHDGQRHDSFFVRVLYYIQAMTMAGVSQVAVLAYVLARVFLIVETFRTLWFLPSGAFRTTWATFLPHGS
jgi:hypothetical protein